MSVVHVVDPHLYYVWTVQLFPLGNSQRTFSWVPAFSFNHPCSIYEAGSRERLPQVGFNTMDGRQLPFPEDIPINRETLLHFCAAFLSGRLKSSLDARRAMVVSRPFSTRNTVFREEARRAPAEIRGVSEQLKPQDAVVQASKSSFEVQSLPSGQEYHGGALS